MKTTWYLTPLFKSDTDPRIGTQQKEVEKQVYTFSKKWKNREDYLSNSSILKTALDEYEKLQRMYGTSGAFAYYFWLRTMQDQTDKTLKAYLAKVDDFSTKMENELQFFHLRLSKIPKEKQKEFINSKNLARYRHFLKRIFDQAAYVLSEQEEKILNLTSDPAYAKWVQMTSAFLSKEERVVLTETGGKETKTLEGLATLINSQNKKVRDEASVAINDILAHHVEVAENEINAVLANKKITDELRGSTRPDFFRHLSDDIDSEVVDTLVEAVSNRFDISTRFYKLKAKLLKVKKLAYHERNVEYGKSDKTYVFDDAVSIVKKVFNGLDSEFGDIVTNYLKNGQLDVYPEKGKRGGAFCAHQLMIHPTYVLLNYTDKLRDITTLAHELGHGINNELIKQKQHSLHFGTPMATAEVASTFMEDFVLQDLIKNSDEETQFAILLTKLNDDISTIFRQVACYQFEKELHTVFREKGYLSHVEIGSIFQKHMASYMGVAVEQSKGSENWWVYWSHIRSYFYVYSYASGLLISKSLQKSVKENSKFIGKVKEFLSTGLSDSPKNIFNKMGIDIADGNFWNKGLDEIEESLKYAEKLARKLGKIS